MKLHSCTTGVMNRFLLGPRGLVSVTTGGGVSRRAAATVVVGRTVVIGVVVGSIAVGVYDKGGGVRK